MRLRNKDHDDEGWSITDGDDEGWSKKDDDDGAPSKDYDCDDEDDNIAIATHCNIALIAIATATTPEMI